MTLTTCLEYVPFMLCLVMFEFLILCFEFPFGKLLDHHVFSFSFFSNFYCIDAWKSIFEFILISILKILRSNIFGYNRFSLIIGKKFSDAKHSSTYVKTFEKMNI
jgi:hypothetical protein